MKGHPPFLKGSTPAIREVCDWVRQQMNEWTIVLDANGAVLCCVEGERHRASAPKTIALDGTEYCRRIYLRGATHIHNHPAHEDDADVLESGTFTPTDLGLYAQYEVALGIVASQDSNYFISPREGCTWPSPGEFERQARDSVRLADASATATRKQEALRLSQEGLSADEIDADWRRRGFRTRTWHDYLHEEVARLASVHGLTYRREVI